MTTDDRADCEERGGIFDVLGVGMRTHEVRVIHSAVKFCIGEDLAEAATGEFEHDPEFFTVCTHGRYLDGEEWDALEEGLIPTEESPAPLGTGLCAWRVADQYFARL